MAEREALEAADGALGEGADARQLEVGERLANVGLRDAELDAPLLEPLGEGLQLAWVSVGVRVERGGRVPQVRGRRVPQRARVVVVVHHVVHAVAVQLVVGGRRLAHRRQCRHRRGRQRVQHVQPLHAVVPHLGKERLCNSFLSYCQILCD